MSEMFIVHCPFAPPRACTPGESIYLRLWQEFVEARPDDFQDIFADMSDPVDQRVASVAASFMVFMGCNGGACFTDRAEKIRDKFAYAHEAFIAAWALENRRHRGTNYGLRTSEYMLAAVHPIQGKWQRAVEWGLVPEVTQKDNDALECMVEWWSTLPAKRMRDIAEPLISAAHRKAMSNMFTSQESIV